MCLQNFTSCFSAPFVRIVFVIPSVTNSIGISAKLRLFVSRAPVDSTRRRLATSPGAQQPVQRKSITFSEIPMRFFVFLLSLSTIYCLPSTPAAHAETVDIGFLGQESISFSTSELIAGTRARVYARIHNFGDIDVTGRVAFHQGTIPLGSSQPISVRAGGAYEEVFVDFTVPEAEFNIRAQIVDTDPAETVTDNNIVLSTMFEPIEDEDQDGVIDDEDNCPSTENPDQQDADGDGKGNVCDEDDDNDSLSDEVEEELGSDPEATDTDGDGVDDGDDATPTVFNEAEETEEEESAQGSTEQELVTQQAVAEEEPNETTTSEPTETESTTEEGTEVTEGTEDEVVEEGAEEAQTVAIERETAFTTSLESWNTYEF